MNKRNVLWIVFFVLFCILMTIFFAAVMMNYDVFAAAPVDIPAPPDGCKLAQYSNDPDVIEWGGWVNAAPHLTCGVSAKIAGQWHTLSKLNSPDGYCIVSSHPYRERTCILQVDGVTLREYSMTSESGVEIQGASVTGSFEEAVSWIPVPDQQIYRQFRTLIPVAFNRWGVCIRGCVGPPPIPPTPFRPLPTPAPTECPGWEDGICDPTPTPYMICFPDGCPTSTPTP